MASMIDERKDEIDRLSGLDEKVAHHILSFVHLEDLAQFMLVSKRCYSLCFSVPFLTVDNTNYIHDLNSRQRFNRFVGRFLDLRAKSGAKTLHFNLVWSFRGSRKRKVIGDKHEPNYDEEFLIDRLLSKVSTNGAQRFSMNMVSQEGGAHFFPYHALNSESVKYLEFCSNNSVLAFLPIFRSYLKSLTLQSAEIPDFNDINKQLRSLEYLYLYDCNGSKKFTIINSKLKELKIINGKPVDFCHIEVSSRQLEKFFLTWYPLSPGGNTSLHIRAAALQHFVWYGYPVPVFLTSENRPHLQCAALYLTLPPGSEVEFVNMYAFKSVIQIVTGKILRLHPEIMEIMYKLTVMDLLNGLKNLAIDYCILSNDQIPLIASCLKALSCLETFYLTSSSNGKLGEAVPEGSEFNVEYWEAQELRCIDGLKKAAVEIRREEGNGLELVKYLLKHAKGLEDLTIVCAPSLASGISASLKGFVMGSTKVNFCSKPQAVDV